MFKSLPATALALSLNLLGGLLATAQAAPVPLFNFESQALLTAPGIGSSAGTVVVESVDTSSLFNFSGVQGWVGGVTKQLLMDTNGGVPFFGDVVSVFDYSFASGAATTYGFSYTFLTNQVVGGGGSNDYFQVVLFDAFNTQVTLAYEDAATSLLTSNSPIPNTGPKTVAFNVGPGSYTVEFLVGTSQQGCAPGGSVCVPTFAVINGAVPEPGSWALVLLSLGAAGWAARRPAGLTATGPRRAAA